MGYYQGSEQPNPNYFFDLLIEHNPYVMVGIGYGLFQAAQLSANYWIDNTNLSTISLLLTTVGFFLFVFFVQSLVGSLAAGLLGIGGLVVVRALFKKEVRQREELNAAEEAEIRALKDKLLPRWQVMDYAAKHRLVSWEQLSRIPITEFDYGLFAFGPPGYSEDPKPLRITENGIPSDLNSGGTVLTIVNKMLFEQLYPGFDLRENRKIENS